MDSKEIPQFDHTPYYCEENVYRLCKKLCSSGMADTEGSDLFVVFISNDKKQIPLWHQKASHRADGVILWDYHVICVQRKEDEKSAQVWDLDSTLPFPSPLASYVSETFRPSFPLFSEYRRFYRIIHAPMFLRCFASDRRHMKDSDGNWNAQPPPYDPIVTEGSCYLFLLGVRVVEMLCCVSLDQICSRRRTINVKNWLALALPGFVTALPHARRALKV
ncbi:protein N-terminal glutamine amidohydrolase isoform X1 [Beta vulgaris subsp. vulgaris]|uniref:protein N-terminal glutamine amidohydrolase isoform X1 n=1 Tax=Beta vulgaris subsp. vulgaris TaxID=3555 RepID=UPI002546C381|nr:protein N-terminal glutamine amidohydrolase isoform X1 [Beta vulgaris subsp. vulgaris]